jgi:hypothetical protein
MEVSKSRIISRLILFAILSVLVYFLMNAFPGMIKIAVPVVCDGDFSVKIKSHEYCYICSDASGTETDITAKTYYTALVINILIANALLYILGYILKYLFKRKSRNSFEAFQSQSKIDISQSLFHLNQQDNFHPSTNISLADLEANVLNHLKSNQKINAIQLYREYTGSGLKESKEKVEEIGRRNGIIS